MKQDPDQMKYYKNSVANLPSEIGTNESDGSRSSNSQIGYLSYGPYLALEPGKYFGGFHIRRFGFSTAVNAMTIDVAVNSATTIVSSRDIPAAEILTDIAGLVGLEFEITEPCKDIELRLMVKEGIDVNVTEILLFRL